MVPYNKDIKDCSISEIVDCLDKQPYGQAASKIIQFFETLGSDQYADFLRISTVPILFHEAERIFRSTEDPIKLFSECLENLNFHIEALYAFPSFRYLFEAAQENYEQCDTIEDTAQKTGEHYGNLFKAFTMKQFLEAKELIETRLSRNNIKINGLESSALLDQGCGGGRYTAAWKLLGVNKAVGVDISPISIEDARNKSKALDIDIEFMEASVLSLPFNDNQFDIVYSNGVLHHTSDWEKGIEEQVRVLKPGGFGWQYLIESPGGIFWDKIEILRAVLRKVDKQYAAKVLASYGIPNNRIFYMLDHVMVPVNTRLRPEDIENSLAKAGAKNIQRLQRGVDFDRVEQIFQGIPYAREKFGVGENRFVFSK